MSDEAFEHTQEDFSISLEGVPLLKKFGSDMNWEYYEELHSATSSFVSTGYSTRNIFYIIRFEEDHIVINSICSKRNLLDSKFIEFQRLYTTHKNIIQSFIKNQLTRCGCLKQISEIYENIKNEKVREEWTESELNDYPLGRDILIFGIVVKEDDEKLDTRLKLPDSRNYHNDDGIGVILTYFGKNDENVLSTGLLFTDQRQFVQHTDLSADGLYPPVFGNINDVQQQINNLYDTTNANPIGDVVLRGVYKSGDSLFFNDMLIKHTSLLADEPYEGERIDISTLDKNNTRHVRSINICKERIFTTQKHIDDRRLIGISFLRIPYNSREYPFNFNFILFPSEEDCEIKIHFNELFHGEESVNLSITQYESFLRHIGNEKSGCFTFSDITFKSRGKKKRKKTKKNKRKCKEYKNKTPI